VSRASCFAGEEARSQVRRAPRNARRGREHDVAGQFSFLFVFFVILPAKNAISVLNNCRNALNAVTAGSHARRQCWLLSVNEYSSIHRMFDFSKSVYCLFDRFSNLVARMIFRARGEQGFHSGIVDAAIGSLSFTHGQAPCAVEAYRYRFETSRRVGIAFN
jgi:hypothetical protein